MATGSFHLDQLAPMVNRRRWAMDRDQLRTCLAKLPGGAARWRCGAWWELGLRAAVFVDKENHDRLWLICRRFRANRLRVPLYLFMLSMTGKGNRGTHAPSGPGEQITKERRSKAVYDESREMESAWLLASWIAITSKHIGPRNKGNK